MVIEDCIKLPMDLKVVAANGRFWWEFELYRGACVHQLLFLCEPATMNKRAVTSSGVWSHYFKARYITDDKDGMPF